MGHRQARARPDQGLRRPLASALHQAVRELGHTQAEEVEHVLGVIKSFAQRDAKPGTKLREVWNPGIDAPAIKGRADSGDIEIDLVELFTDVGGLAADLGRGVAVFIDEMQDLGPEDISAICAACHEMSQTGLPLIVVGAGLPHLPSVLSASKSYSERLFRYQRIDRLAREEADRALTAPAADELAEYEQAALDALYYATGGYPYFIQAYGKAVWDQAPESPIRAEDVRVASPRPSPSWPSASSARATSAPRPVSASTSRRWPTSRPRSRRRGRRASTTSSPSSPRPWPPRSARSRSPSPPPATRC